MDLKNLKSVVCLWKENWTKQVFFRTLTTEFNKDNSLMALEAVLVTERQAVV